MKQGIYINKYVKDGVVESETFDNSFDADHASKRGSQRFNLPYLKTVIFECVREGVNKFVAEATYGESF